jgi:hypothetical protein
MREVIAVASGTHLSFDAVVIAALTGVCASLRPPLVFELRGFSIKIVLLGETNCVLWCS